MLGFRVGGWGGPCAAEESGDSGYGVGEIHAPWLARVGIADEMVFVCLHTLTYVSERKGKKRKGGKLVWTFENVQRN